MAHSKNTELWDSIRSNYSLTPGLAYFDNAKQSPLPNSVLAEIESWHYNLANNPASPMRLPELEVGRKKIAEFIGAQTSEIALTRSATEGINLVLNGFDWRADDEVVFDKGDHPNTISVLDTLEQRFSIHAVDAGIDWYEIDDDAIIERYVNLFTGNTRLLYLSHLNNATGRLLPIKAIADSARAHGVLTILDASQSFGALNYSVSELGVDYLVAPGHKWISAGYGGGFAYLRQESQNPVWPTAGGFFDPSSRSAADNSARRYDRNAGQKNIPSLLGFIASLNHQNEIGRDSIQSRVSELSTLIKNGLSNMQELRLLTPADNQRSGSLVCFSLNNGGALELQSRMLKEKNIYLGTVDTGREIAIRVSPHIHNGLDQIDMLLSAIKSSIA